MKNQYFGDINDYKKYGLLRILSGSGEIRISVCWMLTENDSRNDGKHISYLQKPEQWRKFDSELFDTLHHCLHQKNERNVNLIEQSDCLPATVYHSMVLTDNRYEREEYFTIFAERAKRNDLLFFDPDNGIEVASKAYGAKDSCKYVYWKELQRYYSSGYSLLVYQHFPRVEHKLYTKRIVDAAKERLGTGAIFSVATSTVLYLLVPQPGAIHYFRKKLHAVGKQWGENFLITEW